VELLSFAPKKKEKWEMSSEERVAEAVKLKEVGGLLASPLPSAIFLLYYPFYPSFC